MTRLPKPYQPAALAIAVMLRPPVNLCSPCSAFGVQRPEVSLRGISCLADIPGDGRCAR